MASAAIVIALALASLVAVAPHAALAQGIKLTPPTPALAQAQTQTPGPGGIGAGGTIEEVRIEGTQRVEPETVRSYMQIGPGDKFDSERLDQSLKSLFATGLFSDVTLRREGDTLIVHVVENPVINRVAFEGNGKLSDETLNKEIQLKPRSVYTRQKAQADVGRILDLYRRNGRFAATVDPKIIKLDQNRVDLVFEINEGDFTGVRSINFVGNHVFDADKLRGIVSTKESRWWRFLSTSDTYDPDRISYDRDLLRKFYLSQGYADFRVVSAIAELTPERDGFLVTFTVEEGKRYKFGKVDLVNELKEIDPATLRALITTKEGDWYNADAVDNTIHTITNALGNRGYAFVQVQPRARRNADAHTIDMTYDVQEGPRVYVERIDITGNLRTLDRVIRREMRLVEGDAFSTEKLDRSQARLKNLNYFKKVSITNAQGSAPDKTVVHVNVEEQSTGDFTFGVGFSTTDGPLVDAGIHERNLLGKGLDLRIDTLASFRAQQGNISFTNPYFLDRNVAAGFDIFAIQRNNQDFAGFNQFTLGGDLRAGYQIVGPLRQTVKYTLREDRIYNVCTVDGANAGLCSPPASIYVADQAGTRLTSAVGQTLLYDRRDNPNNPTAGWFVSEGNDVAGAGGDVRYLRTSVSGGIYHAWAPQWVGSITGEGGYIFGIGQSVRIEDRFFVGGDNLRGFATGGIGPRDQNTQDALGGNIYYVGSVTQGFPLGLPAELGLSGRVWTDFGSLIHTDDLPSTANPIQQSDAIRVSAGFGFGWQSPFGPIRIDIGHPILRKSFDKISIFRFGFGSSF
ncbi:MAG: outer membrane protein assembly factor BamA [Alphaproteobacteria bacterium]|nr:outer membrane protein assembly factor BamA [Alphaproteobacteria bacterium]